MQPVLLLAASALPAPAPVTAEQAVERQQAVVRDVVTNPCGTAEGADEILVCGQAERSVPTRRGSGYDPSTAWTPPAEGPWFSFRRGPLTISCCSVRGGQSTGAGLGLSLRF